MKPQIRLALCLLVIASPLALAQQQAAQQDTSALQASRNRQSTIEQSLDERRAARWELKEEEWSRYRELMDGPLGSYSPGIDPLTALGIEARSEQEQRRYAELQVQAEARRVDKLLRYQRAYDEAWQRLNPGIPRVSLPDAIPPQDDVAMVGSGRTALFIKEGCAPCDALVQRLQASGTEFDVYMVGSRQEDTRIRQWALRTAIDPAKVRNGTITLNHDGGRWISLGVSGELPALVRRVNGQWQRQP